MPKLDLNFSVTAIIAICAILSPIFTTLINNQHQRSMEKMRLASENQKEYSRYKRNVYENYLKGVGEYIHYSDSNSQHKYGKTYPLALSYFPNELIPSVSGINEYLRSGDFDSATIELEKITPVIKEILQHT